MVIDPWVALTAIALETSTIKIGLLALPLPRHRPWLVATRLANLDQLSGGRVICVAGLGHSEKDFVAFGEEGSSVVRAGQLDEGLEILTGLWTREPFSFEGKHYTLDQATLPVRSVQSPRIPLWVVGGWPRRAPFRRAARYDGICLKAIHHEKQEDLTLQEFQEALAYIRAHRTLDTPFEVVMSGETPPDREAGSAIVSPFREAGATWWIEGAYGFMLDEFRRRIRSGPPHG